MIKHKIVLVYFLWGIVCFTSAQDMQEGFTYLETGAYAKAVLFFEEVLKTHPDHKTAQLCYGRAVGLAGDAPKAIKIFTQLQQEYPNDDEIALNYAESLLWNSDFTVAEQQYAQLVAQNPTSFPAVLGYANTLSNLKKYKEALRYVNDALQLQPENANALLSRKYIRLGYASTLVQEKTYTKALTLLDQNLMDFPNDSDTQRNKANIYLMTNAYEEAKEVYRALATTPKDSILSLNALALVAHKKHKDKKALAIATTAKAKAQKFKKDSLIYPPTVTRYIQALLWNAKFKAARIELRNFAQDDPKNAWVLSLQATYGLYTSDVHQSESAYQTLLHNNPTSFDGNLGMANTYKAMGKDKKAYSYAFQTLQQYPKQPDAMQFIATLKQSHTPILKQKTTYTFDNGDNTAITMAATIAIPWSTQLTTTAHYTYRDTKNTTTELQAASHEGALGASYKFNSRLQCEGTMGAIQTQTYTQVLGEFKLKTKPFRLHTLDIGYKRELQNFNAELTNRELVMNHFGFNYNWGTLFRLGWYTQYLYTTQTDENTRHLVFSSLYYSLVKRPEIKLGINYQYITFENQVPTIYFSPDQFHLGEVFTGVTSPYGARWSYSAIVAAGLQYVAKDPSSFTYRAEGKLGYQITNRFQATAYGKYSNIASATASGFEFTEVGLRLQWYFLAKPIFNAKIEEWATTAVP